MVNEAGRYADRLSVNVEIPKEENLKLLAPEKDHKSVLSPMLYIQQGVLESSEERKKVPVCAPLCSCGSEYTDDCRCYG